MADYKNAEQYVVEKLEAVEAELEKLKIDHSLEIGRHIKEFEDLREELNDAYELLDALRDFFRVGYTSYFGNYISMDIIYGKEYPEVVARLMEYYDMRPEEGEENA
jgi:hypothetical protein